MTGRFVAALAIVVGLGAGPVLAEDIAPERIIDAVTGDWNKDGKSDLAVLVGPKEKGDDIGILIYLRDADHDLLKPVANAPAKVWGNASLDGMFGQDPHLEALANGSIAVHSENSGIGRDRWEQTLTLAYRNGAFIVAGYTYSHYDTLDPDAGGTCDYNVLTGKATVGSKERKNDPVTIRVEDWNDQTGQTGCGIKQD